MQTPLYSSLLSQQEMLTLQSSLSHVSDGPSTDVNCTDGNNSFTIANGDLSRMIVNGPESVTQVTVIVRMRQAGTNQCTVSNVRVTNGPRPGQTGPNATSSNSTSQPILVNH